MNHNEIFLPLIATELSHVGSILERVHDYWFDSSDVIFDEANRLLDVHLRDSRASSRATDHLVLRIFRCKGVVIRDEAKIGQYDLNEISYDMAAGSVTISSGFPLRIEATVDRLEISLRSFAQRE